MLSDIIPESLKADKKFYSIAKALDAELQEIQSLSRLVLLLPRLDELQDSVLDQLAWQYHVDFYSDAFKPEIKRQMIRESFYLHRIKGTKKAVEKYLSALMSDVEVSEWFDYGGEPYYFKITTGGFKIHLDDDARFAELIDEAKNLRSWLEAIVFDLTLTEPETYRAAQSDYLVDSEVTGISHTPEPVSRIYYADCDLISSVEVTHIYNDSLFEGSNFCGFAELESSVEVTAADYFVHDVSGDFARLCRERWLRWKDNPVIKTYHHHDHDFDEIEDDEPEIFPVDTDFLRLYFDFDKGRTRYLTIYNPRLDLTSGELNAFGSYIAQNKVLLNSAGFISTGLKRALLISKKITNVF